MSCCHWLHVVNCTSRVHWSYILQCKVFSRAAGDILLYPAAGGGGGGHIRLIASITSMTCS